MPGRAFLPYAERALAALHDGAGLLADLERGSVGELVIGAAPAVSTYVLPGVLVRFVARFPSVRLVVRTGHSEEILDMAVRGDIQVGLVRELAHPHIESVPWYDDELVLVVQPGHRFAGRGRDRARAHHRGPPDPVRPDVELLRPDEHPVPPGRRRAARRHGA